MRKTLVLLFGGQSTEHEVSCRSVLTIKRAVNQEKYKVLCIGITKSGEWIPVEKEEAIEDGSWKDLTQIKNISSDIFRTQSFLPCFFWGKTEKVTWKKLM